MTIDKLATAIFAGLLATPSVAVAESPDDPLVASVARPTWELGDDVRLRAGLRLQRDAVRFDDETSLEDEAGFRRARLAAALDWADWRLRADYDLGVSDGWKNLYVQYGGLRKQRIVVGNQVAPFSLEDATSSGDMPFAERSVANALSPGSLFGVSYRTWRDRFSLHAGVFGDELTDRDRRKLPGTSVIARATFAPVRSADATIHLGIAGERREVDAGERVRLRARPGSRLANRRLVDTRNLDGVDGATTLGLEVAGIYRNLRLQAETISTTLESAAGDATLDGAYVAASATFGARSYRYSNARGAFRSVRPMHRYGALEVSARLARLDLSDGAVSGGEQLERTLGLSWVVNRNIRVMANHSDIEVTPNRDGVDEDLSVTTLRLEFRL